MWLGFDIGRFVLVKRKREREAKKRASRKVFTSYTQRSASIEGKQLNKVCKDFETQIFERGFKIVTLILR